MSNDLVTIPPETYDRTKFIGGADIAGILGVSEYGHTPLSIYQKKMGIALPSRARAPRVLKRGKRWESVVGEMLLEELQERGYKAEIVATNRQYVDTEVNYLAAEIDYELRIDDHPDIVNCELKTVHPFAATRWPESDAEDLAPAWCVAQGMHGLGVTRRNFCILAALFGADELRVYPVKAEQDLIAGIRRKAEEFWTLHVLPGVPPEARTLADVNRLFREGNGAELQLKGRDPCDAETISKILRLRAISTEIDAREAEFSALEFDIKRIMGESAVLSIDGDNAVTWKPKKQVYLDQSALKENHPKIAREFTVTKATREFRVNKSFKVE